MDKPTIDNTNAVFQAGATIHTYLHAAIKMLDDAFGEGYAAKHPELVAACIAAQTSDFNNTSITAVLYELKEALGQLTIHLEAADYLPVSLYGTSHGGPVQVTMTASDPARKWEKRPNS